MTDSDLPCSDPPEAAPVHADSTPIASHSPSHSHLSASTSFVAVSPLAGHVSSARAAPPHSHGGHVGHVDDGHVSHVSHVYTFDSPVSASHTPSSPARGKAAQVITGAVDRRRVWCGIWRGVVRDVERRRARCGILLW